MGKGAHGNGWPWKGLQGGRRKCGGRGVVLLTVVMDFHKHMYMPKHKVVQLYLNKTLF